MQNSGRIRNKNKCFKTLSFVIALIGLLIVILGFSVPAMSAPEQSVLLISSSQTRYPLLLSLAPQSPLMPSAPSIRTIASSRSTQAPTHSLISSDRKVIPGIVIVSFVDGSNGNNKGKLKQSYLQNTLGSERLIDHKQLFHNHGDDKPFTEVVTEKLPVNLRNVYRLTFSPETDIYPIITYLNSLPEVRYAEPEYIRYPLIVPNDGLYNDQWGLQKISAHLAWDITTGTSEIKIAVIDTGIDVFHPDLDNKITDGYDYIEDDQTPQDLSGHGTHVSGIAAAETNNDALGQAVAGVSWNAQIVPLRICSQNANDVPFCHRLYEAIWDATNINGVRVINISLGAYTYSQTEQEVINAVFSRGVVVVAAAGNCGDPATHQANKCPQLNAIYYPAAYQHVIAVGATNQSDQRNSFSTSGNYIDVVAPGEQILSTIAQGVSGGSYYKPMSGTSMATPFVSGLAALILSVNPGLSPEQVEQILKDEASDLGDSGRDDLYGWGRINAYRSVNNTPLVVPLVQAPASGSVVLVRPSFAWTSSPTAENYVVQISQDPNFNSSEITAVTSGTSYIPNSDLTAGRTYYWRVWSQRGEKSSKFSTIGQFATEITSPPPPPPVPSDNTPPSANGFSVAPSGGTANLSASGVQDNAGGSGVREVRFSAKFNNQWVGIGTDNTAPYSLAWNMCTSGVPDGDVELGMEVWDNANNKWVWSQHNGNPHITKNYNCSAPPAQDGVTLYQNTGLGGSSCYVTQDAPSIGNYCGSGWNDNAESVRVQGPYYFALYKDDWYGGGAPFTGNPTGDLPTEWRNQASSIRIRRNNPAAFTLYDLGDYNGESWASDRTIFDMGHWNWNDKAESIRVASGYGIIVCEHADFKGVCGRATGSAQWGDINALAQGLRNNVSSIRVCSGACPSAGSPPALNYPINNELVDSGQSVTLHWSGTLNQFYAELSGGGLDSTMQSGWTNEAQWNVGVLPESSNPYTWRVKGWQGYGETSWASGSFYVMAPDTTPPQGTITSPSPGTSYGNETITIQATATDNASGVNRLEFFAWIDDHWEYLGTDTTAPYQYNWYLGAVREGGVWVSADVVDNAGNHSGIIWDPDWSFITIDKTPPSGIMAGPPSGGYYNYSTLTLRANATDALSGVDHLEFFAWLNGAWQYLGSDSSAPYEFNWNVSTIPDGSMWVSADVVDKAGNRSGIIWDPNWLYITLDKTPPSGIMTAPQSNGHYNDSTITLQANATDNLSGVNRLEFFAWLDGAWQYLGTDSSAPYEFAWDVSTIPDGGVWVSADVVDNAGTRSGIIWDPDWAYITLDKTLPSSTVATLSATQPNEQFSVAWSGSDNQTPNSQILYDVQYQTGCDGIWVTWYSATTLAEATFTGINGESYCFRSRATDLAGNVEPWPTAADAETTLAVATATTSNVSITRVGNDIRLSWTHLIQNNSYEIWRSPNPYFNFGDANATLLTTLSSLPNAGETLTYTDTGGANNNDYYFVKASNGFSNGGSNRTGVFSFPIYPGDSLPQVYGWSLISNSSSPSARAGVALAVDTIADQIVLFGGTCAGFACDDTWVYDGNNWQELNINGPSPRENARMVYDSSRQRIVLFGGHVWAGLHLNDTWEFDGNSWSQISTTHTPLGRSNHAMTYDSARGKVVMYGGWRDTQLGSDILNDTWEYDGTDWVQISTANAPAANVGASMKYVPAWGKTIMSIRSGAEQYNQTWSYDGANWTLIGTPTVPRRYNYQMAYHPVKQRIVLFGGYDVQYHTGAYDDTWEFDGQEWVEVTPTISPSATWASEAVYYEPLNGIIMFGGNSPNQNDLVDTMWRYGAND